MIHLAHAVLLGLVLAGAATAQEAPDDPPALAPESLRLQDELRALGAGLNAGRADVALEGVVRGRMRDAILDALDPLLPVPLAGRRAAEGAPAFEAAREIARRAQVRGTSEVRAAVARMAEGDPAALDGIGTRLVEGAGRDAIDSAIAALQARDPFGLAHLEITYDLRADRRPSFAVLAVKPLHEDARRGEVVFLQGSLARGTDDTTLNLGLAYRRLLGDGLWLGGANAFFDRALRQGLNRASVGLDLRSDRFTLSANRYIGLGGWRPGRPGYEVRALSGHDLELSGSLPGMPHLSLSGRVYDWDGAKPVSGREIALIYAPGPHLNARLGYADEGAGDTGLRASFAARYVFGVPLAAQFGAGAPERASVWDRRFEKVRRENTLRTEERIAPAAAGTILESTGANLILSDTGTATAAAGASLPMPATIRVAAGAGAILRVRYGDGAILTLGAGSEVRSAAGVLTLIAGMMQYTSGSETRVIMVPGGQIDLLGTDIDLVVAGDDALVRVRSGAVRASSGPTAVVIAPRELARLDAAGATQVPPEDPVVIEHGAMIAGAIDSVATPMAGARMSPYPSAPPSRLSGGLVEGETIRFAVPFSGPVAVSDTPRLALTLAGRERFATYAEGAGTETLLFDYVIAADDAGASELVLRRLDVASGEIGTAGLPAVLTFAPVTVDLGGTLRRADLEPPAGHSVAFGSGFEVVNAAEAGAVTVVISGAETGAGYALSVSSAGGGAAVTRTGTIAAAETVLSDLDLTGLGDGALTASLVLTDAAGNPAGAVTGSATKDTLAAAGQAVAFGAGFEVVNAAEAGAVTVVISGAETGAGYALSVSSAGGGTAVTRTGTIAAAETVLSGLDLTGLGDGALTASLVLTDPAGNPAGAVTASATKATGTPSVVLTASGGAVQASVPVLFEAVFSEAMTGEPLEAGDLTVTNGTVASVTTADGIVHAIAITPTAEGAVTLEVPAGVAASASLNPNSASGVATLDYDATAPAGHAVAFGSGFEVVNAAEAGAVTVVISGAETGAGYALSVSSAGGGTAVTRTGTIAAAETVLSDLDLTGLGDGALTASLVLTDAAGNPAGAVTGSATKDTLAPQIDTVTGPADGDYDDL